jgi:hypothetical protein
LYEQKIIIIGKIEDVLREISSIEQVITLKEEDFFDF